MLQFIRYIRKFFPIVILGIVAFAPIACSANLAAEVAPTTTSIAPPDEHMALRPPRLLDEPEKEIRITDTVPKAFTVEERAEFFLMLYMQFIKQNHSTNQSPFLAQLANTIDKIVYKFSTLESSCKWQLISWEITSYLSSALGGNDAAALVEEIRIGTGVEKYPDCGHTL